MKINKKNVKITYCNRLPDPTGTMFFCPEAQNIIYELLSIGFQDFFVCVLFMIAINFFFKLCIRQNDYKMSQSTLRKESLLKIIQFRQIASVDRGVLQDLVCGRTSKKLKLGSKETILSCVTL